MKIEMFFRETQISTILPGLLFATAITLLCFIAGTVSVFLDQGIAATVFFGFTLIGIISRFIYGTGKQ